MSLGIDYQAVLEDLRARRDQINAAITAIEQFAAGRPLPTGLASNGEAPGPTPPGDEKEEATVPPEIPRQIQEDTFFSLSATEAARKYLQMAKRPAGTKEIEEALKRGGFLTNAKNFYSNLYTSLNRSSDFANVKGKWGLSEWYPNRARPSKRAGAKEEVPAEERADEAAGTTQALVRVSRR